MPKKTIVYCLGSCALIFGVALILLWWSDVKTLFKGATGILLALGGLFALYSLKK